MKMAAVSRVFIQSLTRVCLTRNHRPLSFAIPSYSASLNYSTAPSVDDDVPILEDEEEAASRAAELEAKRNKSQLRTRHYRQVNGQLPVDPENPIHNFERTVGYRRKLAARYGAEKSKVNLGIAWPTAAELEDMKEYERVVHPHTLQEMIHIVKSRKEAETKRIKDREAEIELKVKKLEGWMKELSARQQKKLDEARIAREKKDALVNEVRQVLGPAIDSKDPKFMELYEKMEKEARKAEKEAKKQAKADKASSRAVQKLAEEAEKSSP